MNFHTNSLCIMRIFTVLIYEEFLFKPKKFEFLPCQTKCKKLAFHFVSLLIGGEKRVFELGLVKIGPPIEKIVLTAKKKLYSVQIRLLSLWEFYYFSGIFEISSNQ
jgi:hypothetical protein